MSGYPRLLMIRSELVAHGGKLHCFVFLLWIHVFPCELMLEGRMHLPDFSARHFGSGQSSKIFVLRVDMLLPKDFVRLFHNS